MIRNFQNEDEDNLVQVWRQANAVGHPFLQTKVVQQIEKDLRNQYLPQSKTWVYLLDKEIVGFICMLQNEIGGLFVLPQYHGQGIGTQLIDHVRNLYGALAVEVFEKNEKGKTFYFHYGFQQQFAYFHEETQQIMLRLSLA